MVKFFLVSDFVAKDEDPKVEDFAKMAAERLERLCKEIFGSEYWGGSLSALKYPYKPCLPLILCEKREDLKRKSILCPYEFIIERRDFLPEVEVDRDDEKRLQLKLKDHPRKALSRRLRVLAKVYGNEGIALSALQDWFAGHFRMYMMLDATSHGTSRYIDLSKGADDKILRHLAEGTWEGKDVDGEQKDCKARREHAKMLARRFAWEDKGGLSILDPMQGSTKLMNVLYPEYFKSGNREEEVRSITAVSKISPDVRGQSTARMDRLLEIYSDRDRDKDGNPITHEARLPLAYGDRAKFVAPSGKLDLLLIDDNIKDSPLCPESRNAGARRGICDDDLNLLDAIFNVQEMKVDVSDGKDIYRDAVKNFRKLHGAKRTFDLILVDLSLGNDQGGDLSGYRMIFLAHIFWPGTPVVVYSRFNDMGRIARGFHNGACWFLVKGDEAKLPRHVLELLHQSGWHREWQAVNSGSWKPRFTLDDPNSEFAREFETSAEKKYLAYKVLEHFPGRLISIKQLGGGISSAVTFRATKGAKVKGEFLQTPSIVKIDTAYNTMMEFERYFRMIRPYMANEAGRIEKPERVLNRQNAAIVYTFAGRLDAAHKLESMGEMLAEDILCRSSCDYEKYRFALDCIFDEILPKIHRVAPELEFGEDSACDVMVGELEDGKRDLGFSSFPNATFDEHGRSMFWKSYVARMQPFGVIDFGDDEVSVFKPQDSINLDLEESKAEGKKADSRVSLSFHNVMPDPEHAGCKLIEAYDEDCRLYWLRGDYVDFVGRFRKQVAPGKSLWFEGASAAKVKERLKNEEKESGNDGRVAWLKDVLQRHEEDEKAFANAVGELLGLGTKRLEGLECKFYVELQDRVIDLAKKAKEHGCQCPFGIIHGDLNLNNIMLESRVHAAKGEDPDCTKTVSDVWFIDFARTRRDAIAHDFNVFFTSVLSLLFKKELFINDAGYWNGLAKIFRPFIVGAVSAGGSGLKGVPDCIQDDARFTLVYKMLRRSRSAARKAGLSQNMYLLTTALTCLYTLKIFLNNKCNVRLAAGCFAAAWICYDLFCEAAGVDNAMKEFVKQADGNQTDTKPVDAKQSGKKEAKP